MRQINTRYSALAFSLVLAFLFLGNAMAYTIDGDVSDWGIDLSATGADGADQVGYLDSNLPSGSNSIDYVTEDNADMSNADNPTPYSSGRSDNWIKVYPGWSKGNTYDAEAMYFDNDDIHGYIAIITGLPETGTDWGPGDIGLDITSESVELLNSAGNDYSSAKTTAYEYGIDLSTGELVHVDSWNASYYDGIHYPTGTNFAQYSDPWAINSSSNPKPGSLIYTSTAINGHYVIETSFLLDDVGLNPGDNFGIHWTMKCGNDFLNLQADVPEPATMLLFGTGLIGLAGLGRKKFLNGKGNS